MSRGPEQLRLTPDERADLVAYIDGELPEGISRSLATKLTHSATGRREVEMLKKTWELLGHLPLPELDPQFTERTLTEIRRQETKTPSMGSSAQGMDRDGRPRGRVSHAGGREFGIGLCGHSVDLARSFGASGPRSFDDRTHGRISGGRLV